MALGGTHLGAALLVALISYAASLWDLRVRKYPETYRFLLKTPAFHLYGALYAVLAVFLLWVTGLPSFSTPPEGGIPEVVAFFWVNDFGRAVVVGLFARGVMNINLFSIPNPAAGSDPIPFGPQTILLLFEPALLRSIINEEYLAVDAFAAKLIQEKGLGAAALPDLQQKAIDGIPPGMDAGLSAAFKVDVQEATDIKRVVIVCLGEFGPKWVKAKL